MSDDNAIVVRNLHKSFKLPHEQHSRLKDKLLSFSSKMSRGYENQHVLKGLDFEIKKGEFFGIVGRNGSGKSTLLKIMAGVYAPDLGEVVVNGSLTPFIELGVGFNPELTGRENVYLNGALLGFSRSEMKVMYDEIVEFAELERFMDQKLKNYSSGMQVRLAFSIAIQAKSDILLLDEVLAVGDAAFQQKCFDYFASLKREKRTVILVSHGMASVERFCDRALLLEKGKIVEIGKSVKIAGLYQDLFLQDQNLNDEKVEAKKEIKSVITASASLIQESAKVKALKAGRDFTLRLDFTTKKDIDHANIGINIRNDQGVVVFSTDTRQSTGTIRMTNQSREVLEIELKNYYTNGKYTVDVHVVNENSVSDKILFRKREILKFSVMGITKHEHSLFHPPYRVKLESDKND